MRFRTNEMKYSDRMAFRHSYACEANLSDELLKEFIEHRIYYTNQHTLSLRFFPPFTPCLLIRLLSLLDVLVMQRNC